MTDVCFWRGRLESTWSIKSIGLTPVAWLFCLTMIGPAGLTAEDDKSIPSGEKPVPAVTAPPPSVRTALGLDKAYTKHLDVHGFSIVAIERTADAALQEAAWLIGNMLRNRPDLFGVLAKQRVRLVVMAVDQFTTDVPEHSDLRPAEYWDRRARGLGATAARPAVSCGEENLLCYPGDPYPTENILIHEFGHAIHEMALKIVDPTFDERLNIAYTQALEAGLWKGTYAATNRSEYWAEGVQSWFDTNREHDSEHNHVNTRQELREYDPSLARLLEEVFGDGDWRYTRPETRRWQPHLKMWNPDDLPRFRWSPRMIEYNKAFQHAARGGPLTAEGNPWSEVRLLPVRSTVQSSNSNVPTFLLFVNKRPEEIQLVWLDEHGRQHPMGRVLANSSRLMNTYRGHAWLVTTAAGEPLYKAVSRTKHGRVLIPAEDQE